LTEAAAAAPVKFFLVFAYHPEKVGAKTNVHKSYKKTPSDLRLMLSVEVTITLLVK
jgi:hypothetical protein